MDVALWSKFPSYYSEGKIAPKLLARGYRVTRFLTPNVSPNTDLSDVGAVLCLIDMSGHKDYSRIKVIADGQNKKLIAFSRKESFWDRDLSQLEQMKMAGQKAIPDDKVEDFCRVYMDHVGKGMTVDQIVPKVQKFWKNGSLTNAHQLAQYIRNLVASNRAPKWFAEFDEQIKRERREQKIAQEQAMEELAIKPNGVLKLSELPKSEAPKSKDQDVEILEGLYKEEVNNLKAQILTLTEQNKVLTQELNKKTVAKSETGKVAQVAKNLLESVELGLSSKDEAFSRLVDFIKKSGA